MATADYMANRKRYSRPQAMVWSNNSGTLTGGQYVPNGNEVGSDASSTDLNAFLILSDDNRSPIQVGTQRIEKRERMINGRMRSYHIADKMTITVSWEMLPSRAYSSNPGFMTNPQNAYDIGKSSLYKTANEFTSDGGAGGVELLDWYEKHPGPFYVFLSYDKYDEYKDTNGIAQDSAYGHLAQYSQVKEMYFASFDYSVEKRGGTHDLWNISVTLEEV